MLAFAPHSVCSVRNPVTPGLKMNVMTSLAGPPTMYVGAREPPPAPVLLTLTEYPQPEGGFAEKFVEQYTRNALLEVHLTVSGCVPGANADTTIFENGWQLLTGWDRFGTPGLPRGFLGRLAIGRYYTDSTR